MAQKKEINQYILEKVKDGSLDSELSLEILKELNGYKRSEDDIAIIGISCRFPSADDKDEYWENIRNSRGLIGSFPEERARDIGKGSGLKAGYIQHIGDFDPAFFRISPKEATVMHPSQRLFMEESWKALEDAGYCGKDMDGANCGVYVGIDHSYQMEYISKTVEQDLLTMSGAMTSVLASRIAFILNLHGPSLVVDTACSSGLVCTHLACAAIKNKECDMAIAGGMHILGVMDAKFDGVDSQNGMVRSFDKDSQGTLWGEGVGFVVLKPYKLAVEDHDHIYAVIKGTAINNDGKTNGVTSPSSETQAMVVERAWKQAKIDPEKISYIEAHATGTKLGDPIEVKGLKMAFEKYTQKKQFCGVGSVKPNIGHGVSSASISSLIKVIMAMNAKELPPVINFDAPNPYIQFQDSPMYVNDKLREWKPIGEKRLAGVSSFGFGRTNAHVVLEESPVNEKDPSPRKWRNVFTLSGKTEKALIDYIKKYQKFVKKNLDFDVDDFCYSAAIGRLHHDYRLCIIADSKEDLINKIGSISFPLRNSEFVYYGVHKVIAEKEEKLDGYEITESEKRKISRDAATLLEVEDKNSVINEVCRLYAQGADIEWKQLYSDRYYRRMPLPTYPFQHKHYWAELSKQPFGQNTNAVEKPFHPLIDKLAVSSVEQDIYVTQFEIGKQWVLTEHLINGMSVIPGTAYIEMLVEAGKRSLLCEQVALSDVIFYAPVVIGEKGKELQTILKHTDKCFAASIVSKNEAGQWVTHVKANISELKEETPEPMDISKLKEICNKEELHIDLAKENGGFRFGPRWRNIGTIIIKQGHVLTEIAIDNKFKADMSEFNIHPAMLDNAANIASEFVAQNITHDMFLPFTYNSLKLYKSLPDRFYSYQIMKNGIDKETHVVNLDVFLVAENGEVIAKIEKYSIKRVKRNEISKHSEGLPLYHEVRLVPKAIDKKANDQEPKKLLVIKGGTATEERITDFYKNKGAKVVVTTIGKDLDGSQESFASFFEEINIDEIDAVLYTAGILADKDMDSYETFKEAKKNTVLSFYNFQRALADVRRSYKTKIVVFADHARRVGDKEALSNPLGAALFGLAQVSAKELKKTNIRCVDIDEATNFEIVDADIMSDVKEDGVIVYRDNRRYGEALGIFVEENVEEAQIPVKKDGVYVITGSITGIANVVSEMLLKKEKVNLAFICRSGVPECDKWDGILESGEDKKTVEKITLLKALEEKGAVTRVFACDVTDYEGMKTVISGLRTQFGHINGIFHGAGLPGNSLILNKPVEDFDKVIAPKMEGAWVIDDLTKDDRPDFMILFSSILSRFVPVGQSDYASANAFLNAYSCYRRDKGSRTSTLEWSVWNETGMALQFNMDDLRGIFYCVTNQDGERALELAMNRDVRDVLVGSLDYERVAQYGGDIGFPVDEELEKQFKKLKGTKEDSKANSKRPAKEIKIICKEEISDIERVVANIWGMVLGADEVDVNDNFYELGGDSIIATELVNAINSEFNDVIDISDVYTYSNIKSLSKYIDSIVNKKSKATEKTTEEETYTVDEIMELVDEGLISLENADKLLQKIQN